MIIQSSPQEDAASFEMERWRTVLIIDNCIARQKLPFGMFEES